MSSTSLGLVKHYSPSQAYEGYTLFAPMGGSGVWLIDMMGHIVHHWEVEYLPAAHGVLLPNGNLLYAGKRMDSTIQLGGAGGELLELDWDGNLIWEYKDPYMHHDFQRLPNGNTMVLGWVPTPEDITAKIKGGVSGTELEGAIWSDSFREINPEGQIIWEWRGYEHLDPEVDIICGLCPRSEWTHTNACSVTPDGNILTSFLTLNTIAIIDKKSGDITWRWGPGELAHQHNPTMLDNGNILVFDNGSHRPASPLVPGGMVSFSRVLEIDPQSRQIVWEYSDETRLNFFSSFISGCQRLPNGNTFICEGTSGRFFEVTPDKELVWEFTNPFYSMDRVVHRSNMVFRAHRYGTDYPGLKGKNLDPDRVELILREMQPEKKKALQERLKRLGY